MRVPADNHWGRNFAEKPGNFTFGTNFWFSRRNIFEQIFHIAGRRPVAEKDFLLIHRSFGKPTQPRDWLVTEVLQHETQRRIQRNFFRCCLVKQPVLVALYGHRNIFFHKSVKSSAWFQRPIRNISQIQEMTGIVALGVV